MTAKEKKIIQMYIKAAYDNLNSIIELEAEQSALRFPAGERFPMISQERIRAQSRLGVLNSLARELNISNPCRDQDDYHWATRKLELNRRVKHGCY